MLSPSLETKRRQARLTFGGIVAGLGLVCATVLSLPIAPIHPGGAVADELASGNDSQARADDLKHRLDEANAKLGRGRPTVVDAAERARAEDLKRQLDEINLRLRGEGILDNPTAGADVARAADLKAQLHAAEVRLRAGRPVEGDEAQQARADDLSRQVQNLSTQLSAPRPPAAPGPVTASLTRDQVVGSRGLFGLYTPQAPFAFAEVTAVESALQTRPGVVGYFQAWTDPFRADALTESWRRNEVPLLTWESQSTVRANLVDDDAFNLPSIISGRHDEYIRSYARGIAALKLPLILRFDHEMNGIWYPWSEAKGSMPLNGNSRGDYVKAWRHVHDVFAQEGANAYTVWLWSPNRVDRVPKQAPIADFYPGDEYVDWVGMSGYYRYSYDAPTFDLVFGKTIDQLRTLTGGVTRKPIFLSEIGATEFGGHKVEWINSFFDGLAANRDIIGFGWFNHTITDMVDGKLQTNDWRVNSSAAAAAAFKRRLADTGFGEPVPAA